MILVRCGYRTLQADSVATAREVLATTAGPLALLVSDIVLPDGSGTEIAELVHRRHPETAILLMSGYAEEMLEREDGDDTFTFLPKPFSPDAMMSAVDEARRRARSGAANRSF